MGPANLRGSRSSGSEPNSTDTMNKLFVITVLVALLAVNTQGFRVARQAEEEVVAEAPAEEIVSEAPVEEVVAEAPAEEVVAEAPAEEVVAEEAGTMTKMTNAVKYYYSGSVDTATSYLDSIRGLKLEEKAMNLYEDTSSAMATYAGIMKDQTYHLFWPSQDQ